MGTPANILRRLSGQQTPVHADLRMREHDVHRFAAGAHDRGREGETKDGLDGRRGPGIDGG